jgi:mono/diheme cytochrome c family protein
MNLATAGQGVYAEHCETCHGTNGKDGVYPNQLVPLTEVATDAVLVEGESEFAGRFVEWFAQSFWGEKSRMEPSLGYIAPPLDGVWATAPFLHNGSIPTLAALLDSTKRPTYWTRTYLSTDYDEAAVGWKFTVVDHGQAAETNASMKVRIYDTSLVGYGNGGHTYGDQLTEDDRRALLEYLKTL